MFTWNLARIEADYRACCRETGRRPHRLVRPHLRLVRPRPEGPPLPPDVFAAVVDALATALVADVRGGGGRGDAFVI